MHSCSRHVREFVRGFQTLGGGARSTSRAAGGRSSLISESLPRPAAWYASTLAPKPKPAASFARIKRYGRSLPGRTCTGWASDRTVPCFARGVLNLTRRQQRTVVEQSSRLRDTLLDDRASEGWRMVERTPSAVMQAAAISGASYRSRDGREDIWRMRRV